MEQVELKPCAFCGGTDQEVGTNDGASWVTCADCGAQGPWHDVPGHDRDGAIAAWNTRHSTPADPALREATGWLIEMVEPEENRPPVPRWWHPEHGWMWDANKALRFAREVDASDHIKHSRGLWGKATFHKWWSAADMAEARETKRDYAEEWNDAARRDGHDPQNGPPPSPQGEGL